MKKRDWVIMVIVSLIAGAAYAAYQPLPIRRQGADKKAIVVDDEAIDMQQEILYQLKILNEYMSRMTGEEISKEDIN